MDQPAPLGAEFDLEAVFEVEDYLYFYRESLTDERSTAETAALARLLALDTPQRILDLACGFGRHANRLAALGHAVTGVDYMPGFLELARRQAAQMGVTVDYRQGDMRQIAFEAEFDRVLLIFTAFGYFNEAENAQVLANVAQALKPGGLFAFDIPNRDLMLKGLLPVQIEEKNRDLMINRISFDLLTGRMHNQRIVIRDGVRKDKPFSIRLYNASEIRALLQGVGLEVRALYGSWEGQPVSPEARRLVIVAQKPI
jgi:SAM-dependent methyltransferase